MIDGCAMRLHPRLSMVRFTSFMTVAHRELRDGARRPFNYWLRMGGAAGAALILASITRNMSQLPDLMTAAVGLHLFTSLHVLLLVLIFGLIPLMTADSVAFSTYFALRHKNLVVAAALTWVALLAPILGSYALIALGTGPNHPSDGEVPEIVWSIVALSLLASVAIAFWGWFELGHRLSQRRDEWA